MKKLRKIVSNNIGEDNVLNKRTNITIGLLNNNNAQEVSELYKSSYKRGDWFGDSYKSSNDQYPAVLNPNWLKNVAMNNSEHIWLVFSNKNNEVVGSTSLIKKDNWISIDETQLDPIKGRRKMVIDTYFRRFVPILYKEGYNQSTEFVLTPESGGLRRVLIGELGMNVTGILPHALESSITKERKSEITAYLSSQKEFLPFYVIPQVKNLLNIVLNQFSNRIENNKLEIKQPTFTNDFESETINTHIFENLNRQKELHNSGYVPLVFNPIDGNLTMGTIPSSVKNEDLTFLIKEANKTKKGNTIGMNTNVQLLNYLNKLRGEN